MKDFASIGVKDLVITAFGAATSAITAFLLYALQRETGFALYTYSFWLVIPIGAMIAGLAASSGYYWGARLLNHRPTRFLLVSTVGVAVGTFFLVHYLNYAGLTTERGTQVRRYVSFGTYLNTVITHSSITFRYRYAFEMFSTGRLGAWGYVYALVKIIGFALGGAGVYTILGDLPFCGACGRYLKRVLRDRRFTDNAEELKGVVDKIALLLSQGRLSESLAAQAAFGVRKAATKAHRVRTEVTWWRCKTCEQNLVRFRVARKPDSSWEDVPEFHFEATSRSPVVSGTAAGV